MIQRLNSSKCGKRCHVELPEGQAPRIIPLNSRAKQREEKKVDIADYIDKQINAVVAFLIKWVRNTYTKELLSFLMTDFKNQIETDILKKLNDNKTCN